MNGRKYGHTGFYFLWVCVHEFRPIVRSIPIWIVNRPPWIERYIQFFVNFCGVSFTFRICYYRISNLPKMRRALWRTLHKLKWAKVWKCHDQVPTVTIYIGNRLHSLYIHQKTIDLNRFMWWHHIWFFSLVISGLFQKIPWQHHRHHQQQPRRIKIN